MSKKVPDILRLLEEIETDTTHGASQLYRKLLYVITDTEDIPGDFPDRLRAMSGDMAPFLFLASQLDKNPDWKGLAEKLLENRKKDFDILSEATLGFLPEKADILCHSQSGTVLGILERISFSINSVYQTISSPGEEGRIAHEEILKIGIESFLISDESIREIIKTGVIPILGADAVTKEFFVNKIGSKAITKFARESEIPVFVIAAREKFLTVKEYGLKPDNLELFEVIPIIEGVIIITPGMKDTEYILRARRMAKKAAEKRRSGTR